MGSLDVRPRYETAGLRRTVWLGNDTAGNSKAYKKFNFLHELGHAVQDGLYGLWSGVYNDVVGIPGCQCGHVTTSNQLHCLQSREHIRDAQVEGLAHFIASDVLNSGTQSNCTFAYYKEFLEDGAPVGSPTPPPVAKSCFTQVRWLDALHPDSNGVPASCVAANRGVEWDWMNFYWSLRNKGGSSSSYSYAQLASVYRQACGGVACTNGTPASSLNFSNVQAAANAVFGPTNARATFWSTNATNFGVNH